MPSPSQIVQIPLGSGLNQRGDARAANPPTLDIARDVQFDELGGLQTRKPQAAMSNNIFGGGTLSNCRKIVENGDELLCFTDVALYSWNAQLAVWVLKGTHLAVKVDEQTRFATMDDQRDADRAELNGTIVYAWQGAGSVYIAAVDKTTGSVLCAPTQVDPGAAGSMPHLVALSTKILLLWANAAVDLVGIAIDPANVAASIVAATTISGSVGTFDAVKIPNADTAIVVASVPSVASYTIQKVTAALALTSSTKVRICNGPIAVAVDPTSTSAQVIRRNGVNIQGDLITISSLADAFTAQPVGTVPTAANQIAAAYRSVQNGGVYRCYVFWSYDESSDTTSQWGTKTNWVSTGNTLGAQAAFINHVGVASRAVDYNGSVYVWLTFAAVSAFTKNGGATTTQIFGTLQNTYFLYRDDGFLTAKAAATTAGGFTFSTGRLPGVVLTSGSTVFSWCGSTLRRLTLGGDLSGYSQRSVHDIAFTFDSNQARRCARIGETLYIACGEGLLQYDGVRIVESGFHVYPWLLDGTDFAAGNLLAGTYAYKGTWRWDNAKGERDRSTTATAGSLPVGASREVSLIFNCALNITHKTANAPSAEAWRTAANPTAEAPFYLVTQVDPTQTANPNRYLANDQTAFSLAAILDSYADATATVKETNPENGSILENLAPPQCSIIIASSDRLFVAGISGFPHRVAYSKQRQDGEIASFNDALTINVPIQGGLITALAILNETLIVFRETAIYAFPGVGFDNGGGGQNYGPAQIISLDVGAVNHEAQALIDAGLIFKSSKGWQILDKRWSVNYIGAPVVDFDADTIYSVRVVRAQQQIRILTNSRIVFFDYVAKEWGEWTITDGIDAVIWQGTYAYLTATGPKTEQAAYSSLTYGMDVEWAWIKMADLQGAGRVRRILILGEYRSDHVVRIRIAYNYKTDGAGGWLYTDDKYWTPSPTTVGDPEQFKIGPSLQQCEAIKIRITAANPAKATLKINVPGSSGSQWMLITVRRPGTAGNAIVFTNDAGAGPTVPTITDGVGTVALSSGAATTFQQVVDAINASSSLISAAMGGAGGGHVFTGTSFTGSPAGGLDWPTGEALKLTGLALELAVNPALNKRLPAAQRT